ncbi:MAG: pyruvate, phosphate dikinase [Gemmatimonadetes bacterium RIFCSPLOWO2_12_FULL_68_9]|nr:MAG: pyruvate, phosphate dikinase [Gemmatimonadetes bacterium RIFCSPLOWO2_12_FULL_68_9]
MPNVYFFGDGHADGRADMKDVLGGKGANLAEMTNLGIPVPPGFTLSAQLCIRYLTEGRFPEDLRQEVQSALRRVEAITGKQFGGGDPPLLLSVRSGAKMSMPGMMDTILNLGLNDATADTLARRSGNARFAYDSYRRLVQMYGDVVFGIRGAGGRDPFDEALTALKSRRGAVRDIDLSAEDLRQLVATFKDIVRRETGCPFPDDPWHQLWGAIEAVFKSWQTKRAMDYRRVHKIPDDLGTAVNVMAMVYGNMGDHCATGVAFTRDPSTGAPALFAEFLTNAQGEDVVAGIRDPEPVAQLQQRLPRAYAELQRAGAALERHFRDMQDVEFTVEGDRFYLLQTRTGKRTAQAAVRIAVDMVAEGLIDRSEAVRRVQPDQIDQLLHPMVDPAAELDLLTNGLPASPGAAVGQVVFDADTAVEHAANGEPVILVRRETSADDFHGMVAAQAILTARGGMTSHAAVVARGMGKCCVAGAKELDIDEAAQVFHVNGRLVRAGDWLTVDGSTGRVILGRAPLVEPKLGGEFGTLMSWADQLRRLRVRANADTPADARRARGFGAEGIGLCRTEHMFFEGDRIQAVREMIVARDHEGRQRALAKIEPMQREDFIGIFREMDGLPVTIRLLDPPLHEFLPRAPHEVASLATSLGVPLDQMHHIVEALAETNPMLGHRGCRLGITYPEITEMQARAIFEAACAVAAEGGSVHPEVMVPLVAHVEELRHQVKLVRETAEQVFGESRRRVEYLVGTMIELPRAAVVADDIATLAEFFSFGTNDLTQTTFGLSRDDAGRFLPFYVEHGILPDDPFQTLDFGVKKLVELGVRLGRQQKPALKVGICGEHGGDPRSIAFCHQVGLNYVSCSPFRVPVARLAAAQAALGEPVERDV